MILSRVLPVTLALTVAATACGGTSADDTAGSDGGNAATLLAGTSLWADITSRVACGESVGALIPSGADPHTYESSLQDRALLESADLLVLNGGGLETSLVDMAEGIDQERTLLVDMVAQVGPFPDPHVWQDPQLVLAGVDAIEQALVAIGRDGDEIAACADAYRSELESLDADIAALIATVPRDRRVMVTNHDALGHFADRYEIEVVGTVIPSTSTLADASAADLAELTATIREQGVETIFTEEFDTSGTAEALAERTGLRVTPLVTDALATDGPQATYIGMMRANAAAITEGLQQSAP